MKFSFLGNSGIRVSAISMGCMSLSAQNTSATNVILHALDLGINFFDTADLYEKGQNELLLGKALKGKRKDAIIATKVGNHWTEDGNSWVWNPSKKYILEAVDNSLRRLGTDYIDLYQLHGGTIDDPIDETIEAFELLKANGKIREYGISSIRPNVIREYVERSNICSVMMQYSLLDRRPEEKMLDLLQKNGVSVITRGTLAKGLLAGKPATEYLSYNSSQIIDAYRTVEEIALKEDSTSSNIACRFVLGHPAIASAVVGFRTKAQLEDCQVNNLPELARKDLNNLHASISPILYQQHR